MVAGGGSQGDGGEKPDGDAKTSAGPPLESSRAERSVWLLKLPANVGTAWQQMRDAKSTAPLARLTMSVDPLKPEASPQVPSSNSDCRDCIHHAVCPSICCSDAILG